MQRATTLLDRFWELNNNLESFQKRMYSQSFVGVFDDEGFELKPNGSGFIVDMNIQLDRLEGYLDDLSKTVTTLNTFA